MSRSQRAIATVLPALCLLALGHPAAADSQMICGIDRVVAEKEGVRVFFVRSAKWDVLCTACDFSPVEIANGTIKLRGESRGIFRFELGLLLPKGPKLILLTPQESRTDSDTYNRCEIEFAEYNHAGIKATAIVVSRTLPPPLWQSETKFIPAEEDAR